MLIYSFESDLRRAPELFFDTGLPRVYLYVLQHDLEKFNAYLDEYQTKLGREALEYLCNQGLSSNSFNTGLLEICRAYCQADMTIALLERINAEININVALGFRDYFVSHAIISMSRDLNVDPEFGDFLEFLLQVIDKSRPVIDLITYQSLLKKLCDNNQMLRRYPEALFKFPDYYRQCLEYKGMKHCIAKIKEVELDSIKEISQEFTGDNLLSVGLIIIQQQTELL